MTLNEYIEALSTIWNNEEKDQDQKDMEIFELFKEKEKQYSEGKVRKLINRLKKEKEIEMDYAYLWNLIRDVR